MVFKKSVIFSLMAWLLMGVQAVNAGIFLDSNQDTFGAGEVADFFVGNTEPYSLPVDVYIAFKLPGDDALYFWPSFSTEPVACVTSWVPETVPKTRFFSYKFLGQEPIGEYKVYAAFFKAGELNMNSLVGEIAEKTFYFSQAESRPQGPILKVIPENGQSFSTVSPVFSISFISPVDLESIKWNSSIVIESLVSGKQATTYSENRSLWVRLYIPDTDGSGEMWIMHRVSKEDEALVTLDTTDGGSTLTLPVHPVQIEGETFSLHHGGYYRFTINFLEGARLLDGTSLSGITLGPIDFRIE